MAKLNTGNKKNISKNSKMADIEYNGTIAKIMI